MYWPDLPPKRINLMFTSGCLFEERVLYGEERVTSLSTLGLAHRSNTDKRWSFCRRRSLHWIIWTPPVSHAQSSAVTSVNVLGYIYFFFWFCSFFELVVIPIGNLCLYHWRNLFLIHLNCWYLFLEHCHLFLELESAKFRYLVFRTWQWISTASKFEGPRICAWNCSWTVVNLTCRLPLQLGVSWHDYTLQGQVESCEFSRSLMRKK